MRVISIIVVQDEADIIEDVIKDASSMTDLVLVYDTGSVDGTLKAVREIEKLSENIHIIQDKPVLFHEFETRRHAFSLSTRYLKNGDWVAWLDADEFFGIKPSLFIRDYCQSQQHDWIRHRHYNFAPTADSIKEREGYFSGSSFDRSAYSYYKEYSYVETKLFKYRKSCERTMVGRTPRWLGSCCKVRIPIMHYPYRTAAQVERRIVLRQFSKKQFSQEKWNRHWKTVQEIEDSLYKSSEHNVKKYHPEVIKDDLRRLDGRYDSREKGYLRLFTLIRQKVRSILTRSVGLAFLDNVAAKRMHYKEPEVIYKTPELIAEYKELRSNLVLKQEKFKHETIIR